jgi:hypothetical protein
MDHAPRTVARASQGGSPLRRGVLAVGLAALTWAVAPGGTATVGLAAQEAGSMEVAWQATADYVGCINPCGVSLPGTASGTITGVDNGTPYSLFWPGSTGSTQNATVQYSYAAVCQLSTPTSSGVNIIGSAAIIVTGAQLLYGAQPYSASVRVDFGANRIGTVVVVSVSGVTISYGSSQIVIAPQTESGGTLQMVPTLPAVGCLTSNTQGYAISGTLVTFRAI